jgi:hypothetical protein
MPTARTAYETQLLPPAVAASTAYAAGEIRSYEYNAAIHVAELKPYYETIWAAVKVGDVVLMPWPTGKGLGVEKATITNLIPEAKEGRTIITAFHQIKDLRLRRKFDAEEAVFIQSRF